MILLEGANVICMEGDPVTLYVDVAIKFIIYIYIYSEILRKMMGIVSSQPNEQWSN